MEKLKNFREITWCPICRTDRDLYLQYEEDYQGEKIREFFKRFYDEEIQCFLPDGMKYRILSCKSCKHGWQQHVLDDVGMSYLYGDWISESASKRKALENISTETRERTICYLSSLFRIVNPAKNGQIKFLDYGAGWGTFSDCARALGAKVKALEVSQARRSYCERQGLDVIECLPDVDAAETKYDVVLLNQVLEHVVNPRELLEKILEHTECGGIVVVNVPDSSRSKEFIEKGAFQPLEHVNAFTRSSLEKLGEILGLEERFVCPSLVTNNGWGFVKGFVFPCLPNSAKRLLAKRETSVIFQKTC